MDRSNELDYLANRNNCSKELYGQKVRKTVADEYPFLADELAIIRKELRLLRSYIENAFGTSLPETEFTIYDKKVEDIKKQIKNAIKGG